MSKTVEKNYQKTQSDRICPYCRKMLETPPQRKKKCPLCGNYILVRTHPDTGRRILATEKEATQINGIWNTRREKKEWMDNLEMFGVAEQDYKRHRAKLTNEWGRKPGERDVFWRILNELVANYGGFQDKAQIYGLMVSFLREEGKDFSAALEQHHRMILLDMKQSNCTKVKIRSSGKLPGIGCDACEALNGKVYTIEQALLEMPLPCKDCTSTIDGRKGYCRCFYQAVEDS